MFQDETILLVEDNRDDELLTLRAFTRNRIANPIVVVRDGEEALDYLFARGSYAARQQDSFPVLILLDLKLPKLDGHEVLRAIRQDERTRLIPVIILTTSAEEEDIVASYDLGANSYIRKPVDFSEFMEAIRLVGTYWLILNEQPRLR
ncbi:chemotaxis protein CheY [Methanocalculus chunghsingensis]|uniref:Chemotaxis protein CheY n=1 Tax=Methanocalculus chunghsingensis TaxID=156457 RepID=A0A8J8B6E2_9EURY|nr:response regulator [Methanocalculus chunghsingensis]MBR1368562.1 chemotaxis protein CheY [Methanocalculus chunghsingensis]